MTTPIYAQLQSCRICSSDALESILDFGNMALTGVFVDSGSEVEIAPMNLGRCRSCGLVQLLHNYDLKALYGSSYGYESHLNGSMRKHLNRKARMLENRYLTGIDSPVVVDIASNDGYLLQGYSKYRTLIGVDPLMNNFSNYYPDVTIKIDDFFTKEKYFQKVDEKAHLVTSLSVLYDLNDPIKFAQDVNSILVENGIWHFEQSYLPLMVDTLSYDTVCHEHLTYLRLNDIQSILNKSGFEILDASLNSVNGGSIAVTARKSSKNQQSLPFIDHLLAAEEKHGYLNGEALREFASNAVQHKDELLKLLKDYKAQGFEVVGLGASTKGNVLLQWLGLTSSEIAHIGDINPRKFGKQCPGSGISITSEEIILERSTSKTIAVVLPWHFRDGIIENCEKLLDKNAKLLFPLPRIEVVS